MNRRTFCAVAAGAAYSAARLDAAPANSRFTYCAFIKFVQSLPYDELAEKLAQMGYHGVETTVRKNGIIEPEQVEEELPKFVEALQKHGLQITIMASDVNRADDSLSQKVLKTAAKLGVKRYRMKYYRYDLSKPILAQLDALRPVVKDLAALNRELGLGAVYQNHAGANVVGASLWDLRRLLEDHPPQVLGVAFDIRHATVEGGLAWPTHFQMIQPHLAALYMKDFRWQGRKPDNVPLGKGQVDPKFYQQVRASRFRGPVSVHVEYLPQAGVKENLAALGRDLAVVRRRLEK